MQWLPVPWRFAVHGMAGIRRPSPSTASPPSPRASYAGRVLSIALWGLLPLALTIFTVLRPRVGQVHFAGDFHYAFWPAGQRVLHGLSPYADPGSPTIGHSVAFVYPALAALALTPAALIPHAVADGLFAALELLAALLTLGFLGVRDWRLYGLVLMCPAVFSGWTVANVSLLLGLGVALTWRYRDRPAAVGVLTGLLISLKLFLWPLGLWLLATRRYAALAYAAAGSITLSLAAWAVLGFGELQRYGRLLHAVSSFEERRGYSLISLALRAGAGDVVAYALAGAVAAGVGAACVALGRSGRDRSALALAIGVSLLATPIVQLHYFALLLVPLALARTRLGIAWALPVAMWACASDLPLPWQTALALSIGAATVAIVVRTDAIRTLERGRRVLHVGLARPSTSSVAAAHIGR